MGVAEQDVGKGAGKMVGFGVFLLMSKSIGRSSYQLGNTRSGMIT